MRWAARFALLMLLLVLAYTADYLLSVNDLIYRTLAWALGTRVEVIVDSAKWVKYLLFAAAALIVIDMVVGAAASLRARGW